MVRVRGVCWAGSGVGRKEDIRHRGSQVGKTAQGSLDLTKKGTTNSIK